MLTGKYGHNVGLNADVNVHCPYGLGSEHATVGDVLQRAGYYTAMVGKWHLGRAKLAHTPTQHGFNEFVGTLNGGVAHVSKRVEGGLDLWRNRRPWVSDSPAATIVAQEARRIMTEHASVRPGRPLFLYLSLQTPGPPLLPEADGAHAAACAHLPEGPRRDYCSLLASADAAIGSVVRTLQDLGWWDNATVALTSASTGNPWLGSYNYPFRGGYGTLWEGGVRGLALLRSPAHYGTAGYDYHGLAHAVDWLPTLATLAGAGAPATGARGTLDGIDLAGALSRPGEPSPRSQAVLDLDDAFEHSNRSAIRLGKWKMVLGRGGDPRLYTEAGRGADSHGVRSVFDWIAEAAIVVLERVFGREAAAPSVETAIDLRYYFNMNFRDAPSSGVFLYDLEADPHERYDLSDDHRDVVRRCLAALSEQRAQRPPQLDVFAHHTRGAKPLTGLVADQPELGFWGVFLDNNVTDAELAKSPDVWTPPMPINRLRRQLKMTINLGFVAVIALTYRYSRRRRPAAAAPGAAAATTTSAAVQRTSGRPKRD